MKIIIMAAIVSSSLVFSTSAQAARGFVAFGGSLVEFDDNFDPIEPVNLLVRGGVAINEYFEIGAEYSFSLVSDTFRVANVNVDFDVDTLFLFAKANMPLRGGSKLYVMVGASDVTLTASNGGFAVEGSDKGSGYGIGIQIPTSQDDHFAFEYIQYYDEPEFDGLIGDFVLTGFNLNYVGYFR